MWRHGCLLGCSLAARGVHPGEEGDGSALARAVGAVHRKNLESSEVKVFGRGCSLGSFQCTVSYR